MIDHVKIPVGGTAAAKDYDTYALEPRGYRVVRHAGSS
jgi:hypothetical protein